MDRNTGRTDDSGVFFGSYTANPSLSQKTALGLNGQTPNSGLEPNGETPSVSGDLHTANATRSLKKEDKPNSMEVDATDSRTSNPQYAFGSSSPSAEVSRKGIKHSGQQSRGRESPTHRLAANFNPAPHDADNAQSVKAIASPEPTEGELFEKKKLDTEHFSSKVNGNEENKHDLQLRYETYKARLLTYQSFTSKLSATSCAEAGFIYIAKEEILLCVWCGVELDIKGVEGLSMSAYHEAASSNCPFVQNSIAIKDQSMNTDAEDSDEGPTNVVTVQRQRHNSASVDADTEEAASSALQEHYQRCNKPRSKKILSQVGKTKFSSNTQKSMKNQRNRILSFKTKQFSDTSNIWSLAADGFYLSTDDVYGQQIVCVFCDARKPFSKEDSTNTEYRQQVEIAHRERACPLIMGEKPVGNVPDVFDEATWKIKSSKPKEEVHSPLTEEEDVGINYSQAAHPEMAVLERRQQTFLTLPYGFNKHSQELYESGLFFAGNLEVICFSCGSKFTDFDETQSVWTRHIRTAPQCTFVKHQKGQDFINNILEQFGPYTPPPPENRINTITTRMLRPRMEANVTNKALHMGLSREEVRNVISTRIKQGKSDFKTVAEIFRAVHEARSEERKTDEPPQLLPIIKKPPKIEEPETMETETELEVVESEERTLEVAPDKTEEDTPKEDPLMRGDIKELALQLKAQLTCKICLSEIVGIIFLPCGHLPCCINCSAAMVTCPLCRNQVNGTVKANFIDYQPLSVIS